MVVEISKSTLPDGAMHGSPVQLAGSPPPAPHLTPEQFASPHWQQGFESPAQWQRRVLARRRGDTPAAMTQTPPAKPTELDAQNARANARCAAIGASVVGQFAVSPAGSDEVRPAKPAEPKNPAGPEAVGPKKPKPAGQPSKKPVGIPIRIAKSVTGPLRRSGDAKSAAKSAVN